MDLVAIVEIPKFSITKYEFNKETKVLEVSRVLPIPCPFNYGFIPSAPLSADGDPLDIFILNFEPLVPLSEVNFRPLGILLCNDNGVEDNKVLASIVGDNYVDYEYFKKIKFYLQNYKEGFKVLDYKIFNDPILFKNFIEGGK
jgi:inorganic pyrophosphatase